MSALQPWREPGGLRESAKAAVGALLVVIWWQFVRFTGPVGTVPCGTGVCPALQPNWLVLGMAVAATLVGLDWVRSAVTDAAALVAVVAGGAVLIIGVDVVRVFAGHYLARFEVGDPLAIEFLAFVAAGLLIAVVGVRALSAAAHQLAA